MKSICDREWSAASGYHSCSEMTLPLLLSTGSFDGDGPQASIALCSDVWTLNRCNRAALQPQWLLPNRAQTLLEEVGASKPDVKWDSLFIRSLPPHHLRGAALKQSFLFALPSVKAGFAIFMSLSPPLQLVANGGASYCGLNFKSVDCFLTSCLRWG